MSSSSSSAGRNELPLQRSIKDWQQLPWDVYVMSTKRSAFKPKPKSFEQPCLQVRDIEAHNPLPWSLVKGFQIVHIVSGFFMSALFNLHQREEMSGFFCGGGAVDLSRRSWRPCCAPGPLGPPLPPLKLPVPPPASHNGCWQHKVMGKCLVVQVKFMEESENHRKHTSQAQIFLVFFSAPTQDCRFQLGAMAWITQTDFFS